LAADHTSAAQTIYAAVAQQNGTLLSVYKSANNGTTWTDINPSPTVPNIVGNQGFYDLAIGLSPVSGRVILGGQEKIATYFPSTNTWQDITTGSNGVSPHADYHAIAFDSVGNAYAGTDGGLWRYNVAAGTWDDLNANPLQTHQLIGIALHPSNKNTLLEGSQDNGVALTTNGGGTWNRTQDGDGGLVAYPDASTTAYAISGDNGSAGGPWFYKSGDTGATWEYRLPKDDNGWPFYPVMALDRVVGVRPGANTPILLGSNGSIWESWNGAATWRRIGAGLDGTHAVTALSYGLPKVDAGEYSVYAAFDDGRMFRMDRNSFELAPGTWTELPHPWGGGRAVGQIAAQPGGSGVGSVQTFSHIFEAPSG
jgi:hypothetical protein